MTDRGRPARHRRAASKNRGVRDQRRTSGDESNRAGNLRLEIQKFDSSVFCLALLRLLAGCDHRLDRFALLPPVGYLFAAAACCTAATIR